MNSSTPYSVFIVYNPDLLDLGIMELELKCPVKEMVKDHGGVLVNADLDWIERAHTLLKIPTRFLLRIHKFKVRDFPKLYQKLSTFKWNDFLSHPEPEFEISCTKSRLMHTGRIEETIRSALTHALKRQPLSLDWQKKNYPPQTFYIRLLDDELTLSLDLTGEPLYKRGLQIIKGEAPLRENLASAFLMELFLGIEEKITLVDPMCGSGTFLTEAENFHRPLHLRPFAFETAPFYKGRLLKLSSELMAFPLKDLLGFDLNQELISKVSKQTKLKLYCKNSVKDSLDLPSSTLMITNPPYGERIVIQGKRGSFLKEAWEKFLTVDRPLRFGWVLPRDMDDLFGERSDYRLLQKRHLKNGGLPVTFWLWERI